MIILPIETISLSCRAMPIRTQGRPIDGSVIPIPRHIGGVPVEGVVGYESAG